MIVRTSRIYALGTLALCAAITAGIFFLEKSVFDNLFNAALSGNFDTIIDALPKNRTGRRAVGAFVILSIITLGAIWFVFAAGKLVARIRPEGLYVPSISTATIPWTDMSYIDGYHFGQRKGIMFDLFEDAGSRSTIKRSAWKKRTKDIKRMDLDAFKFELQNTNLKIDRFLAEVDRIAAPPKA